MYYNFLICCVTCIPTLGMLQLLTFKKDTSKGRLTATHKVIPSKYLRPTPLLTGTIRTAASKDISHGFS